MPKKITFDDIKIYVEDMGYELLSTEYTGVYGKLDVKCDKGHAFQTSRNKLKRGYRCGVCKGNARGDIRIVQEFVEKQGNGCTLLSETYTNATTPIKFRCKCGNEFSVPFAIFNHANKRQCNECGERIRTTSTNHSYEYVNDYIKSEGFKLLSDEYVNNATPLTIECERGHPFQKRFNDFRTGSRCPTCTTLENQAVCSRSVSRFFRSRTNQWRRDTIEACGNKCVLTSENVFDVHHLRSFNGIIFEAYSKTGLPQKDEMMHYSQEERKNLIHAFDSIHEEYGVGVCISKPLHILYHSTYGNDNTHEQFEEFKQRYLDGEFVKELHDTETKKI